MNTTLADMDQQAITRARELAAIRTIPELTAYFAAERSPDDISAKNPLASFFGRGTMILADMLAIVVRQQAEIARLGDENEHLTDLLTEAQNQITDDDPELITEGMACMSCGKPVREYSPGEWMHKLQDDSDGCTRRTGPVMARVDV